MTLITPNRRLSATLHKRYQQDQLQKKKTAWETPDILPLSSWLERLWHDYASKQMKLSPLLLNATQEHFLWESIILRTKENEQLLQISETAELAKSGWSLLQQWEIDIYHPLFLSTPDSLALQQWILHFQKTCQNENWLDTAALPNLIALKIKQKEIIPPATLVLAGFTDFSPQIKTLFRVCEEVGSKVTLLEDLSTTSTMPMRASFIDAGKEIETMARFAKLTLEKNPDAHIGCVIPGLEKVRDRVVQIFSDIFNHGAAFNISAGKKLIQYPLINTALLLLSLYKKNISIDTLSYLLASPFLGDAEIERIKRALFDSAVRQANINHLDLTEPTFVTKYCPQLAKRLTAFFALVDTNAHTLTCKQWVPVFLELLTVLGWPGERSLNSEEYQVVENWLKLLTDFTSLDHIKNPLTFESALSALQKMAAKAIFQAQSPDAPIQILGVLEAAGSPFDYVWMAGMDDLSWPPQPKPHPFIPRRLQRELNMPHATAERELVFCQRLLQQFKENAAHLIFSHAEKQDELELQASPLIRDIAMLNVAELHLKPYETQAMRVFHSKEIEWVSDNLGPSLQPNEKIRGGINVIKQQALCPFKAFSEWRLHAHALEYPRPGLRAKDRGTLIHKILELVWNVLLDHATLISLDETALNEVITKSINQVLDAPMPGTYLAHVENHYLSLEKARLHKLIWDWLQVEKERPPFKVLNSEKATQLIIDKLTLSIRIDRVDELADGKKLILDYKTSKNNDINAWFSERPEEPQLPLYSLLDRENNAAITFAEIKSGEHCFKGISHYDLDIKGIKPIAQIKKATAESWSQQLTQWDSILKKLSNDFYQGEASVDPKDADQTCLWCSLKPFCRVNEESTK